MLRDRMSDIDIDVEPVTLGFEAYGVGGSLSTSPGLLDRARPLLPPGWKTCAPPSAGRFSIAQLDGGYDVQVDDVSRIQTPDLDVALGILDAQIRAYVSLRAPDRIFVHAGVVASARRAIVIPGRSFSGKTTLVAALIAAGATYYSDEYAVLDAQGLVHAYPKPLSIRGRPGGQSDQAVQSIGGGASDGRVPIGLIAVTSYRPGASWQPQRQSPGAGAMALLSNTVPARDRPAQALAAVRAAAASALVLEGERGEAPEMACELLDALRSGLPTAPPVS
jgi:hypothetical protein